MPRDGDHQSDRSVQSGVVDRVENKSNILFNKDRDLRPNYYGTRPELLWSRASTSTNTSSTTCSTTPVSTTNSSIATDQKSSTIRNLDLAYLSDEHSSAILDCIFIDKFTLNRSQSYADYAATSAQRSDLYVRGYRAYRRLRAVRYLHELHKKGQGRQYPEKQSYDFYDECLAFHTLPRCLQFDEKLWEALGTSGPENAPFLHSLFVDIEIDGDSSKYQHLNYLIMLLP